MNGIPNRGIICSLRWTLPTSIALHESSLSSQKYSIGILFLYVKPIPSNFTSDFDSKQSRLNLTNPERQRLLVIFGIGSLPGIWYGPPVCQVLVREEGSHRSLEYMSLTADRMPGVTEVFALSEEAQISICLCDKQNIVDNVNNNNNQCSRITQQYL